LREPMDELTRRAWSSPELIVLVRSGPEEAVLSGCKAAELGKGGPQEWKNKCLLGPVNACVGCSTEQDT